MKDAQIDWLEQAGQQPDAVHSPLHNAIHNPLQDPHALRALLDAWLDCGWLRALDRALAAFLLEREPECDARVLLAAALVSHQLGHGHVCLDLGATLAEPDFALSLPPEGEGAQDVVLPSQLLRSLTLGDWQAALAGSRVVDTGQASDAERPLVLVGERLYLRRYFRYEQQVVQGLQRRLAEPLGTPDALPQRLATLFADSQQTPDWERIARLTESIGQQVGRLPVGEAVSTQIPSEVSTLHRLLGSLPDSRHFRHHAGNPLALDVLVIDEASMIDLEMMASVLNALPPGARLILLGDKDQLASVEARYWVICAAEPRADSIHRPPVTGWRLPVVSPWLRPICRPVTRLCIGWNSKPRCCATPIDSAHTVVLGSWPAQSMAVKRAQPEACCRLAASPIFTGRGSAA